MKNLTEEQAFCAAASYCSRGEHCRADVLAKLKQWGNFSEEVQNRIVSRLTAEGYVDEQRFCRAFVHDKFRFNHWGKQKIALYLRQKGISSAFISESLEEISEDNYDEMTEQIIASKLKTLKAASPYELYAKLLRFAAGRGIEQERAHAVIKRMLSGLNE